MEQLDLEPLITMAKRSNRRGGGCHSSNSAKISAVGPGFAQFVVHVMPFKAQFPGFGRGNLLKGVFLVFVCGSQGDFQRLI